GRPAAARASAHATARCPSTRPPRPRGRRPSGTRPRSARLSGRADEIYPRSDKTREGALVALAGLRAVHGRLRLAVREQDDGGEREHPVAAREPCLLVDVHAHETDALAPRLRDVDEVRLDR